MPRGSAAPFTPLLVFSLALIMAPACGRDDVELDKDNLPGNNNGDGGNDGATGGDTGGGWGGTGQPDPNCVPGNTECTDCIDNDGDGLIDGMDPECTGPLDNREGSFATGISGDNMDPKNQDCFFDGNSGHGDDGCNLHTCCLLTECPSHLKPFDPTKCEPSPKCLQNCKPLVPPGCDCFGCCTVCKDGNCRDVLVNPAVSPECDQDTLLDASKCLSCTKKTACAPDGDCTDPSQCMLCPGQTVDDLPSTCTPDGGDTPENRCPGDAASCKFTSDCGGGQYCSVGCCITALD